MSSMADVSVVLFLSAQTTHTSFRVFITLLSASDPIARKIQKLNTTSLSMI